MNTKHINEGARWFQIIALALSKRTTHTHYSPRPPIGELNHYGELL